jgi:hypothetical protein
MTTSVTDASASPSDDGPTDEINWVARHRIAAVACAYDNLLMIADYYVDAASEAIRVAGRPDVADPAKRRRLIDEGVDCLDSARHWLAQAKYYVDPDTDNEPPF